MAQLSLANGSVFDFADAMDDAGTAPCSLNRARFGLFARQVAGGGAITAREDPGGELVWICGLYMLAERPRPIAEAWWAVGPAMKRNLWPALELMRRMLEQVAQDAAPLEVRAHIAAASVAGGPVARLFRFQNAGFVEMAPLGRLEVWRRVFAPCPRPSSSRSSPRSRRRASRPA